VILFILEKNSSGKVKIKTIRKPNNLKPFGNMKINGSKRDWQHDGNNGGKQADVVDTTERFCTEKCVFSACSALKLSRNVIE